MLTVWKDRLNHYIEFRANVKENLAFRKKLQKKEPGRSKNSPPAGSRADGP